ncbi:2Fe-2S iron-sulfur cluster-binding protein [Nonomuraea salmonea]|uniref:2Fe-2S iron-sulfur cluster-binding protein n=1 Tax=Nonomuraea salmonea TaxID=46181 RepID=UPI003CD08838
MAPHQPPGEPGTGPLITFARSGLTVAWSPRHRSLLDLADACDVPTRWSCRTGVCHTCRTPLLSGDVEYAPDPLEPPPAGQALICCSRPPPRRRAGPVRRDPRHTCCQSGHRP